jgi:hypothetical protein
MEISHMTNIASENRAQNINKFYKDSGNLSNECINSFSSSGFVWSSGQVFEGALSEISTIRAQAEQELFFATSGLDQTLIAAILVWQDETRFGIRHLYALPEVQMSENLGDIIASDMARAFPHHAYCGFMTLRPSTSAVRQGRSLQ